MEYRISNRMTGVKPSIIREILKQMSDPALISFAGGNPAADSFPVEEIAAISDKLLRESAVATLQYSITEGVPTARAAMRAFVNRKQGETVAHEADDLIVTTGSQQVMELVAKCLCDEGDIVAVESPAFLGSYNAFRSNGAVLAGVPMEDDGVDLCALEAVLAAPQKPKFFYCIPNFQNPTGVTMSLAKRKAVYELAVRYGVPVLEDDPYGAIRFAGQALPPIKSFDKAGAVVYAGSFSKVLCPGMRLAYCIGPRDFLAKLVVAKQADDVHTNVWAQRVCEAMLTQTDIDAHIARVQALYGGKARHMMACLDAKCPQLTYKKPEGGMFLWAALPKGVSVPDFVAACLAKKLAVVPGYAFLADETQECPYVRLNFSTPTAEQIEAGVEIMAQVLREMTA